VYKIIGGDGKEYGPVTLEQLRLWLTQGRLNRQTRVKAATDTEWKSAAEIPELAALFDPAGAQPAGHGPPPLIKPAAAQKRDTGLAVTSLVLGLSSISPCPGVLTGIPAIICGHLARRRARRSPDRYGGAGLAFFGFALGYVSIALFFVLLAMGLPAVSQARRQAMQHNVQRNGFQRNGFQRNSCQRNLREIGLAFKVWALDHNDQYPFNVSTNAGGTLELCQPDKDGFDQNALAHFLIISNELTTPLLLVCPNDHSKRSAADFTALGKLNITYRLRTGANINSQNPQEILAVCPLDGNSLYCDGNVRARPRSVPTPK
jgi:hypothetical protein